MLKWAVGQRNPTPGQHISSCYSSSVNRETRSESLCFKKTADRLHIARRKNCRGDIRKASIRSLRRTRHDKENQPCSTPENIPSRTRDNSRISHMALRDVSNSPDPYMITPQRHHYAKRRQSHPLNLITKKQITEHSKSAPTNIVEYYKTYSLPEPRPLPLLNLPQVSTTSHETPSNTHRANDSFTDVVDMRKPNSTLKSLLTMQIEYSPGPLTATQSLVTLRRRLTTSLTDALTPQPIENPLYYALNPPEKCPNNGITISCSERSPSPTLEALMEEKSIFDQVTDKFEFINNLKKDNSRIENTLVSSLSQRLEWLRLNNSLNNVNLLKEGDDVAGKSIQGAQDISANGTSGRKRRDRDLLKRQKCLRRKIKKCCDGACKTRNGSCCDKNKPKTQERPKLMGLTLPLGIPSPITSEDSGLCSLGLEGIHPLSSSPIDKEVENLTEEALSAYRQGDESISTSLIVEKCSPSSICSSLRKRLNEDDYESRDAWSEKVVPLVKTPKIANDPRFKEEDSSSSFSLDFVLPSPLALVEKRSRSRRCLRFVSPGSSTCQRHLSLSRRPLSLSCPRLRDGRDGPGELELSVSFTADFITVHVGRGIGLHRPTGTGCNAYVKVALVPSTERTFFRTPVHRESSCPNFNEKFFFKYHPEDLSKQILVSVWHRDRTNRKSEFLGCVSLVVKNAIKKEISGSFRLVAQSGGSRTSNQQRTIQSSPGPSTSGSQGMMARRSGNTKFDEIILIDEEPHSSPDKHCKVSTKKKLNDDSSFLRHLELEPINGEGGRVPLPEAIAKGGRTPFTTTKQLTKQPGTGFGFSIAWLQPPRVERVEAGLPADRAGIRPGDFVIFIDRYNVVMMSEEQVLQIIKSCGNELTLEIYRKSNPNGVIGQSAPLPCSVPALAPAPAPPQPPIPSSATASATDHATKWTNACSANTSTSMDYAKRRLHLPQVAFTNEAVHLNPEDSRKRVIYQLLNKEQNYVINLQYCINRFLVPLTERRDFLNPAQHHVLFQNIQEILRLTEETLEHVVQEEIQFIENFIGRLYLKRIPSLKAAYRRYCSGIKRADCLLAEKSKSTEFNRFCAEPPIPRKRLDLTTFLHKPLEHYREILRLLQTILNMTKTSDADHVALSKVVMEMQSSFKEVTAGLMEPEVEGRPLLSLQDIESRLVFTRCKPFVLSTPGRQWIFGGDLSRIEGRVVHPFWALLFTDMMVFAKISRDRVLFVTEEPLSLLAVSQAFFNIRKRANEFRLLLSIGDAGTDSPVNAKCGPDIVLNRTPKKNTKCKSVALRAPTPELKAVWQNLIQRQIIYLNTTRGLTPTGSPLESPDPPTTLSPATLDSLSLKRQVGTEGMKSEHRERRMWRSGKDENANNEECCDKITDIIDNKCRQLSLTKTGKDGAYHLAEWMKAQLGNNKSEGFDKFGSGSPAQEDPFEEKTMTDVGSSHVAAPERGSENAEPISVWSKEESSGSSRAFESAAERRPVAGRERTVSVCRECHKTCLNAAEKQKDNFEEEEDCEETWGPLIMLGMCGMLPAIKNSTDPFAPIEPPSISVLPPTPDKKPKNTDIRENSIKLNEINECIDNDDGNHTITSSASSGSPCAPPPKKLQAKISEVEGEDDDTVEESVLSEELPYKSLTSTGLRRFGTLNSLERVSSDDPLDEDEKIGERLNLKNEEEGEGDDKIVDESHPLEMGNSIRGWTVRAGSFVAAKMAFFERLSSPDNSVTVRKTTFLERYLKPSGENHLESPDVGTNTSSSGRGEDEGETSGATSGEDVWGTPTSGGEMEEEFISESAALPFVESPCESIDTEDDADQLMEDLLLSLPMLAVKAHGVPIRRRLEPLPEEDDSENSSAPCTPKLVHRTDTKQGRGSNFLPKRSHDITSETSVPAYRKPIIGRQVISRPRVGIDRALGIHSDDEEVPEENQQTPSIFRKLGLMKNLGRPESAGKEKRLLGFLSCKKAGTKIGNQNSATYGARPLFRYLFNKNADDEIPTTLPRGFPPPRRKGKHFDRRFWNQLTRGRNSPPVKETRKTS